MERITENKEHTGERIHKISEVVRAKPMTRYDFAKFEGKEVDKNSKNAHGYLVFYEDGSNSWWQKDNFERGYAARKCSIEWELGKTNYLCKCIKCKDYFYGYDKTILCPECEGKLNWGKY